MEFSCSSTLVAEQQSVSVKTLYPFSYAVLIDDSTQQFVKNPEIARFVILF